MADSQIAEATSSVVDALTSSVASLATSAMAPDSTITSMASMVTSAGAIPTITIPGVALSSWVTVTGLAASTGTELATAVVPYLDPYSTLSAVPPGATILRKLGDHESVLPLEHCSYRDRITASSGFLSGNINVDRYNLVSLTTNPFFQNGGGEDICSLGSCSLILSYTHYLPAAGPTLFLLALFALGFLFHLPVGVIFRTWGYMVGLVFGCGLEVAGYVGRWGYRTNPFIQSNFLLNIICLTIGPAFLTASIYLCLARIIMAYGSGNARFQPRVYTITFMCGDLLALVLQAAGGGIASTADPGSLQDAGINIMIAGLVVQVVSLLAFILFSLDFAVCLLRGRAERNPTFLTLTKSLKWKAFLGGLAFATVTIFIRCCYRVAELSRGFRSDFAQDEVLFSALESAMIGAAVIALSIFHPGFIFGKETWVAANFSVRGRKLPASSSASDSSGVRAKEGRVHTREL